MRIWSCVKSRRRCSWLSQITRFATRDLMTLSSTRVRLSLQRIRKYVTEYRVIGEGTIILLAGPPGVGKTLTSEAGKQISKSMDTTRSHLIMSSCGEI